MTERWYRLIQGLYLIVVLYFELDTLMYVFIGLMAFEGITNLRLPLLISKTRNSTQEQLVEEQCYTFSMESERLLRLVVMVFLLLSYVVYPDPVWFFPWFVAAMLFLAGITNICPMVIMFRLAGFR